MTAKKVALITGASMGIGAELAKLFAADAVDVVLVARSEDKLQDLAQELETAHGIRAHVVASDLSDPEAPAQLFAALREQGIEVDYLVNNAGFGALGAFAELLSSAANGHAASQHRRIGHPHPFCLAGHDFSKARPYLEHRLHRSVPTGPPHGRLLRDQGVRFDVLGGHCRRGQGSRDHGHCALPRRYRHELLPNSWQ
jgi:NAD(P)-dependent dehydrogenase (short-subunit alcohol dehydrogenase family)